MSAYDVTVRVQADGPAEAARVVIEALGFDEYSINEVGGVRVDLAPEEKQCLVCINCGEAFDNLSAAHEHGVFIPGADPRWCGEEGFSIVPESEAF